MHRISIGFELRKEIVILVFSTYDSIQSLDKTYYALRYQDIFIKR